MDKKSRVSKWLQSELKYDYPSYYAIKNNDLNNFYKNNDKNLLLNDTNMIDRILCHGTDYDKKFIQVFKDKDEDFLHYLNPHTPRYQANMIFNEMIDYCISNGYYDNKKNPIINKSLRNRFYKFCYENTYI